MSPKHVLEPWNDNFKTTPFSIIASNNKQMFIEKLFPK